MKHALQISVSKKTKSKGIASVRTVCLRERFLRFLFGDKVNVTVIVPRDSVEELKITEVQRSDGFEDYSFEEGGNL